MSRLSKTRKAIKELGDAGFLHIGVRTTEEPMNPSDLDSFSFVWVDGEQTDEPLPGLSTTGIDGPWEKMHITKDDPFLGHYFGDHLYVVAGDEAYYGQDPYEVVIVPSSIVEIT